MNTIIHAGQSRPTFELTEPQSERQFSLRKSTSKRNDGGHVARQKSRRRELLGRRPKQNITVDTSFTTHRGNAPHQVFPRSDDRAGGLTRKYSWFVPGRASGTHKGLGIHKGAPQPNVSRRTQTHNTSEPATATSEVSSKSLPDISPWDRRIPIGISVPTDSVPDYSSYQGSRYRTGSDTTLVTPSIIVTPADAMKSVWSPDTPYSESDCTPSTYSFDPNRPRNANIPPVPALPPGLSKFSNIPITVTHDADEHDFSSRDRIDTLDSAGTAFEEDIYVKRKDRIVSAATVFEEDEVPLQNRTIETSLVLDTNIVPTPRRSQGWWNFITTPFIATPNTATWPKSGQHSILTPEMPMLPTQYYISKDEAASPSTYTWSAADSLSKNTSPATTFTSPEAMRNIGAHVQTNEGIHLGNHTLFNLHMRDDPAISRHQESQQMPDRSVTSPLSAMSVTPVVEIAAIGTVLAPRQVEDQLKQINVNIELQDKRPIFASHTSHNNDKSIVQPMFAAVHIAQPAAQESIVFKAKTSQHSLPVFAPPPTSAQKISRFSYDNHSRSSSPASVSALKGNKKPSNKSHKMWDIVKHKLLGRKHNRKGENEENKRKKKRGTWFWGCCCCIFIFLVLLIVILAVVLVSRSHHSKPTVTQSGQDVSNQWLNLPNLPPIPTGISTIAQPEAAEEQSGCVAPTTLWSCALPKEQQGLEKPNKPNQPNFKVQITYGDGTSAKIPRAAPNAVSVGAFAKIRRAVPSPTPALPSDADMNLLGSTTDGNAAPFKGEDTPLFITFLDPLVTTSRLAKRADSSDPTNITAAIPPPMLSSDGTAAPANLIPFPSAQPLRLYNRGRDDEHYGFYTYFDRSIFLKDINGTNRGGNPADINGGSTKDAASLRCTYSETRFLVQIWTQSQKIKPLLQSSGSGAGAGAVSSDSFKRPGTFPYPVTITIDRHGGNAIKKNLYCYRIESDGSIKNDASRRSFQFEDRAFGGNLVNGTQGRTSITGPIDGGTGGCRCKWQNWIEN